MVGLYWFRAFNRADGKSVFQVLLTEETVAPPGYGKITKANEARLNIPSSVYVYLGQAVEVFGSAAFVLREDSFEGNISPFDTGGLVGHHKPVCEWPDEEKIKYLNDYTWSTADLATCVSAYPTLDSQCLKAYLTGVQPKEEGPHECFSPRPRAAIWRPDSSLKARHRAWLWEGRVRDFIRLGERVHKWACPSGFFLEIEKAILTGQVAVGQEALAEHLLERYHPGGVTSLVESLREEQVTR